MTMPQPVPMRNQPRPNAADHAKLWILHGAAWLA